MKKKLGIIVLSLVLAMSCIGFAAVSAAEVGETDPNWTTSGTSGTTAVVAEDGYTKIGKLNTWGDRAGYNYAVVLDGLEISVKNSNLADIESGSDMYSGIVFGAQNGYVSESATSSVTLSMWKQFGQGRLLFQYSHSPSGAKMNIYTEKDTASAPLGMADGCLVFSSPNDAYTVRFTLEDDGQWYKVEIIGSGMDGFADVNTGYSADTDTATGYTPVSVFGDFLSDEGEIYVTAVGFKGGEAPEDLGFDIKITDENSLAYEQTLTTADEKVTAYDTAAGSVTDETSYDAAIAARTDAMTYVSQNVRPVDMAEFTSAIAAADAKIAGSDTAEAFAKAEVNEAIAAAKTLTDAFATETNITTEALASAQTAVSAAQAKVADYKNLVKAATFTELETAVNAVVYDNNKANVTKWFIDIEAQIDALDTESETIGADIAAVKAVRAGWQSSSAHTLYGGHSIPALPPSTPILQLQKKGLIRKSRKVILRLLKPHWKRISP